MRPFRVHDAGRVAYHAAATVASNHLVALLGQAARLADAAGVPPAAFFPLVRATLENVETLGPEAALTGPVARGDVDTVRATSTPFPTTSSPRTARSPSKRAGSPAAMTPRCATRWRTTRDHRRRPSPTSAPPATTYRARGGTVGLVPTMGFFHEGHRSLMRAARAAHDVVVVSLFVNPTQFGPNEDLDAYPRDLDGDTAVATPRASTCCSCRRSTEMYPDGAQTTVHVAGLTERLCGASRPGHFDGVTTVVTKLFSIVGPCTAYFGRKDAQQLAVVRRMAADLDLPVEVVGCPLVREPDGLAMSSRNAYLSSDERGVPPCSPRAALGGRRGRSRESATPGCPRSFSPRSSRPSRPSASTTPRSSTRPRLQPLERIDRDAVIALAAFVGTTRLIDNIAISFDGDRPESTSACSPTRKVGDTMHRIMMKSKIHRATVTGADLNYVGSITLDPRLMELADIIEHEQVHVLDIDNGARFETYVIRGGPGDVILNGAAARLVHPGDKVIVITYAHYDEAELEAYEPLVVHVDEDNQPTVHSVAGYAATLRRNRSAPDPSRISTHDRRPRPRQRRRRPVGRGRRPAAPGSRSRCSPRASWAGRPPGTRRVAWPPRSSTTTTRPSCTAPTRSPPAAASATPTRSGCSQPRARTRARAHRRSARSSTGDRRRRSRSLARAATPVARVVHAGGDATGAEIERALVGRGPGLGRRGPRGLARHRPARRGRPRGRRDRASTPDGHRARVPRAATS